MLIKTNFFLRKCFPLCTSKKGLLQFETFLLNQHFLRFPNFQQAPKFGNVQNCNLGKVGKLSIKISGLLEEKKEKCHDQIKEEQKKDETKRINEEAKNVLFYRYGNGNRKGEGEGDEQNEKSIDTEKKEITKRTSKEICKESNRKTIFFESERIIKCVSGNGGDGNVSFKKYKRKVFGNLGIPNGGKGGNGGSIFLCFTNSEERKRKKKKSKTRTKTNDKDKHIFINNLNELPCVLNASNGEKGKANQLRGKDGTSIFIHLDKPCFVYELFGDTPREEKKESSSGISNENLMKCVETVKNENISSLNTYKTKNTVIETYIRNYEQIYYVLKKNDPVYVKRNNHILKELIKVDKKIKEIAFLGFLNEHNDCLLLSKGGAGGKGNNLNNVYSCEKGEKGTTNFIKILYKCISDVCFIGCEKSGKSTLLSLISNKIYTVNNLYILKKIFYKDNFQISVADFFTFPRNAERKKTEKTKTKTNEAIINNTDNVDVVVDYNDDDNHCNNMAPAFYINPNLFTYLHLTYLYVIVLDFQRDIMAQFLNIRNELKRRNERTAQMPYLVVINKCDVAFKENIKKAEEAYIKIKKENENVSIFFVSGKYALGIENFVACLRSTIENIKQK